MTCELLSSTVLVDKILSHAERLAILSDDSYAVALARLAAGLVCLFSGEWRAAQTTLDAAEHTHRLWAVLWLELWHRIFVERSMTGTEDLRA